MALATLFRLVRDVDHVALQAALQEWLGTVAAARPQVGVSVAGLVVPLDQIALDGKTVRGASARRPDAAPLHLVAADMPALAHVLDQKDNQPRLLADPPGGGSPSREWAAPPLRQLLEDAQVRRTLPDADVDVAQTRSPKSAARTGGDPHPVGAPGGRTRWALD